MITSQNIYITTPIYYINDKPHIGHTYSTFTADILARFYRLLGYNTFFATGTDENSQKTVEAAKSKLEILKKLGENFEENLKNYEDIKNLYQFIKEKGLEKLLEDYLNGKFEDIPLELVQAYTDYMASIWRKTWENLKISFNDFIRTTEERHKKAVEKFYLKAKQNGYVYKGKYKGLYCWKCEAFYKESDLIRITEDELRRGAEDKNKRLFKDLTEKIINIAFKVHSQLGRGLQEKVYQNAMKILLEKEGFKVEKEYEIPLYVDGKQVGYGKIDLLVNNQIAIEIKSTNKLQNAFKQLRKYLSKNIPVGLILNFFNNKLQINRLDYNFSSSDNLLNKSSDKSLLLCPIHKFPVEEIEEENYFFKLTAFENQIEKYLNQNHIFPEFRKKELINNFLKEGLEDFSISREGKKWGIPFPDDPNHVFYVWYDALTNYLSVLGYAEDSELFEKFWKNGFVIHIIGKDIIKFHAIYWPAMLWAADEKAPDLIAAHGFFTINGEKISKSLGNAIPPTDLTDKYGIDAVRYYLFKDLKFGNDGDFSFERLHDLYNTNLLGGWGNLVSRVTKLAQKNNINQISPEEIIQIKDYLSNQFANFDFTENNKLKNLLVEGFDKQIILDYIQNFDFQGYLNHWYELIQFANKLIDLEKPWEKLKNEETKNEGIFILKTLLYLIRQLAILSSPILIESFEKIIQILGEENLQKIDTTNKIKNIKEIFDINKFTFKLNPGYLYKKV